MKVDDVQKAWAFGQQQDVDGQREASEEGEDQFHVREAINLAPPHLP